MKKIYIVLLIMVLTVFTACGKKNAQEADTLAGQTTEDVNTTENINTKVSEETLDEKKDESTDEPKEDIEIIGEQYSNEGDFVLKYGEEDSGYSYEFSYHLPEILDDSSDAKSINNEIYKLAENSIKVSEEMSSGKSEFPSEPEYMAVSYESYINDDIVSIIVRADSMYSDWRDYSVFNYNKATHKKVSNSDLFKATGLSEEEFIKRARTALGSLALGNMDSFLGNNSENDDEKNATLSKEDEAWRNRMIADFLQYYMYTIAEENINKDMMCYIDGDGDVCVCGLVYVPAGAGQYYSTAKLSDKTIDGLMSKYKKYAETYHYDGFERDCLGLYELEGYSGIVICDSKEGRYEEDVYIGFLDSDPSVFLMQINGENREVNYSGSLKWIDCNENGMQFEYELTELDFKKLPDDEICKGSFYLRPYGYFDDKLGDYISGAYYQFIDGIDMLNTREGQRIELSKSFG